MERESKQKKKIPLCAFTSFDVPILIVRYLMAEKEVKMLALLTRQKTACQIIFQREQTVECKERKNGAASADKTANEMIRLCEEQTNIVSTMCKRFISLAHSIANALQSIV